ncbi:MAG: DUF3881 family protein [Lachnospiraceae bacterium]|nr:DUF3881 family protein [Lachnospiraceae bacterium]
MHKYLRAVGFSNYQKKSQIDDFFKENLKDENLISTYISQDMRLCGQYNIQVCQGAGVSVIGEQERNQLALMDFYYPYLKGYDYTLIQECTIERHSDKDSYAGIIDDYRMGIALIFYLTNGNVYNSLIKTYKPTDIKIDRIFLSALSTSGRIILPIDKKEISGNEFADKSKLNNEYDTTIDDKQYDEDDYDESDEDDDSIDDLLDDAPITTRLIGDMDDFSDGIGGKAVSIGIGIKLPRDPIGEQEMRLKNEDLYSIVETSLVPYGIECDKYQIVAEIISVNRKVNKFTGETLVEMRVDTMGLQFNLMINENDLEGEPLPGRRFRGVIWLLGEVEFLTKTEDKGQEAK